MNDQRESPYFSEVMATLVREGSLVSVPIHEILIPAGSTLEQLFVVHSGFLQASCDVVPATTLDGIYHKLEQVNVSPPVVFRYTPGMIIGDGLTLMGGSLPTQVCAVEDSTVIAIAHSTLTERLAVPSPWRQAFYRLLAAQSDQQWRQILALPVPRRARPLPPLRVESRGCWQPLALTEMQEVLTVGECCYWAAKTLLDLPPSLSIVIQGSITLLMPTTSAPALAQALTQLTGQAGTGRAMATFTPGEVLDPQELPEGSQLIAQTAVWCWVIPSSYLDVLAPVLALLAAQRLRSILSITTPMIPIPPVWSQLAETVLQHQDPSHPS